MVFSLLRNQVNILKIMNLTLKKECREKLRKPIGKLIKKELLRELKNKEIITVGDKTTQTILGLGLKPKLAIVDYRIERKNIEVNYRNFSKKLKAKNKPGQISIESVEKIKESKKYKNCLLEIDGEEDLLVLPSVLELEKGIVCYGQPNEGIVVIKINNKSKEKVKNLFKECFQV